MIMNEKQKTPHIQEEEETIIHDKSKDVDSTKWIYERTSKPLFKYLKDNGMTQD